MLITSTKPAKPFLKWAGGKTRLLPKIAPHIPSDMDRYFDPYVGGGSVFFHVLNEKKSRSCMISDINPDLINCYRVIREDVDRLIATLKDFQENHSSEYYYQIRSAEKPVSGIDRAARMIYLNKTCYNGLYRENSKGIFNVPLGRYKNPKILDSDNLLRCSEALQLVTIIDGHYSWLSQKFFLKKDFVYLDPPYHPISKGSFTKYSQYDFGEQDQEFLKNFCDELSWKGVRFLQSNSDCEFIRDLYGSYSITSIDADRSINSKSSERSKKVSEVLIKNY